MEEKKKRRIKKAIIIIMIIGIGGILLKQSNKPFDYDKRCKVINYPNELVQPSESKALKDRLPITLYSYYSRGDNNICELIGLSQQDEYFKIDYSKMSKRKIEKEIKKKEKEIEKSRKEYIKRLIEIEKRSSVMLTDFERKLIAEIYIINKFNLKTTGKGSYTYTAEQTPEKFNFFFKETGGKIGVELIDFYYIKNGKSEEYDISNIYYYNTPYMNVSKDYKENFQGYGKFIFANEMMKDSQKEIINSFIESQNLKQQDIQLKIEKQKEEKQKQKEQKQQIKRENIEDSVSIQERNLGNNFNNVSPTTNNNKIQGSDEKQEEIPLPPKPQFVPKEIKKPNSKRISDDNE